MASSELSPSKEESAPTTICALGADLLCEVFLRLPSLPTLVRAALTCPAFLRAVRSSPKFRRRFRDLHPAPLIGVFFTLFDRGMPWFMPTLRWSDPDNAVLLGADVFLTRVPYDKDEDDGEGDSPGWPITGYYGGKGDRTGWLTTGDDEDDRAGWTMTGCRDGYVVLVNPSSKRAAVYDPLAKSLHLIPAPPVEICEDPEDAKVEFHLITSEEDRRSVRVVFVCKERRKVRVAVFSPDSRDWQISPQAASLRLQGEDNGTLVTGCVYWASAAGIHVLNVATLQFSRIDPSPHMVLEGSKIGVTSDGKLCVAEATSSPGLFLWVWRADDSGVDQWMRDTAFGKDAIGELKLNFVYEPSELELHVVAIIGGTVYLFIFQPLFPAATGWLLSFCMETKKLKKVCAMARNKPVYPYAMAWPPVLVSNKVNSHG